MIKKFIASVLMMGSLFVMPLVNAELKTYMGTSEYIVSDFENQDIAKLRAKARAEQDAKDKISDYLKQYLHTESFSVSDEDVLTVINCATKVEDVSYKTETVTIENTAALVYIATVKVSIDTDNIDKYIRLDEETRVFLKKQNSNSKDNDIEVEDLRKRLRSATSDEERAALEAKLNELDNEFLANSKFDEGNKLSYQNNFEGAVECYSEVIKLKPDYLYAYINRGDAYYNLKDYAKALEDYTKAIKLNLNFAEVYIKRGNVYAKLGEPHRAQADFDKAARLKKTQRQ